MEKEESEIKETKRAPVKAKGKVPEEFCEDSVKKEDQ